MNGPRWTERVKRPLKEVEVGFSTEDDCSTRDCLSSREIDISWIAWRMTISKEPRSNFGLKICLQLGASLQRPRISYVIASVAIAIRVRIEFDSRSIRTQFD